MNNTLKRVAILFAVLSCMLLANSAFGADDWTVDFDIGVNVSSYNTDKPACDGLSDVNLFLGITARQTLSERLTILEGVHLEPLNIEQNNTVARDMNTVDIKLGLEYMLTPWPPPVLKWLKLSFLPKLSDQTRVYLKVTTDFLFPEDSWVDQDNFNTTFFGLGWRYNNPVSKMDGSFIEIGTGGSERFDSTWRYFKNNIEFYYRMGETRDSWKAFISSEFDVGSGDDDFRFSLGLSRDANFIVGLLKGLAGK
jgi:hypothetical protein